MEMVESVYELKSSRSIAGNDFPNFEVLDARIAPALNNIVQNQQFKEEGQSRGTQSPERGPFLRGRQTAFMIYDYFRVTSARDTVLDYADLFSVTLRNDGVQEFDTRWDEILLSMTKVPSDDLLESLYKLRIRESEQLKTILEIHQKVSMPNVRH